ncbi:trypsin-like serine protease with C-terminal PDZ domain [Halovivax ruber XH-70]|uniref:Trypsin-like serine protease with C-terminal PDZ domain n=1 Tax=Halovivax ruber (strain DSM 18193 / JCM 13892 / XH-70) TaxID=797302 RepID=L0I7G7_HALRX|nr:trypsin-like peptidase domain-containing protein [Halovivax ruber]AGB14728.1 trypsin-like serine protease with C-terminal PDZ domain [Halovivax ruber XH-70]
MDDPAPSRRAFLAAGGGGILAAIAGCAEPGSRAQAGRGDSSLPSAVDFDERADGTVYTGIYADVIDSVAMVTVSGGEDENGEQIGGQGSAFVYDGHLVTNNHVVEGASTIQLQYTNGDWTEAEVVGTDVYSDLAALDVVHRPEAATSLSFTDVLPTVGQEVVAVGNPYGLEGTMSRGIVSGVNRSLPGPNDYDIPNAVQTDAGVNPGNSGGPLLDMDGRVVGMINAGIVEGVGFAISAALATRVLPSLIETGRYEHPRMGVRLREVTPAVAAANDLEEATGVMIVETPRDGPADGVLQGADGQVARDGVPIPVGGDVVVGLAGEPVPDNHALSRVLSLQTSPGQTVAVELIRDGERTTVDLTLGARPVSP